MKAALVSISAAAALMAVASSPLLAKTKYPAQARAKADCAGPIGGYGSGTNRFAPYQNCGEIDGNGPIYRNGRYLGQDPDPNIRAAIIRDQNKSFNR